MGPKACLFTRTGELETHTVGRRLHAGGGGDGHGAAAGQATPRIAGPLQKLGKRHGVDRPSEPLEGANPADSGLLAS